MSLIYKGRDCERNIIHVVLFRGEHRQHQHLLAGKNDETNYPFRPFLEEMHHHAPIQAAMSGAAAGDAARDRPSVRQNPGGYGCPLVQGRFFCTARLLRFVPHGMLAPTTTVPSTVEILKPYLKPSGCIATHSRRVIPKTIVILTSRVAPTAP